MLSFVSRPLSIPCPPWSLIPVFAWLNPQNTGLSIGDTSQPVPRDHSYFICTLSSPTLALHANFYYFFVVATCPHGFTTVNNVMLRECAWKELFLALSSHHTSELTHRRDRPLYPGNTVGACVSTQGQALGCWWRETLGYQGVHPCPCHAFFTPLCLGCNPTWSLYLLLLALPGLEISGTPSNLCCCSCFLIAEDFPRLHHFVRSSWLYAFQNTRLLRRHVSYPTPHPPDKDMSTQKGSLTFPPGSHTKPEVKTQTHLLALNAGLCLYHVWLFVCPLHGSNLRKDLHGESPILWEIPKNPIHKTALERGVLGAVCESAGQ